MYVLRRYIKVLADNLEVDEAGEDVLDYFVGNGVARVIAGGELGIVEGNSSAGVVEGWQLGGAGVGYREADAVASHVHDGVEGRGV